MLPRREKKNAVVAKKWQSVIADHYENLAKESQNDVADSHEEIVEKKENKVSSSPPQQDDDFVSISLDLKPSYSRTGIFHSGSDNCLKKKSKANAQEEIRKHNLMKCFRELQMIPATNEDEFKIKLKFFQTQFEEIRFYVDQNKEHYRDFLETGVQITKLEDGDSFIRCGLFEEILKQIEALQSDLSSIDLCNSKLNVLGAALFAMAISKPYILEEAKKDNPAYSGARAPIINAGLATIGLLAKMAGCENNLGEIGTDTLIKKVDEYFNSLNNYVMVDENEIHKPFKVSYKG